MFLIVNKQQERPCGSYCEVLPKGWLNLNVNFFVPELFLVCI